MTPLEFEARHAADWTELAALLARMRTRRTRRASVDGIDAPAKRLMELYRRACQQAAIARGRQYPQFLVDRLEGLIQDAHQLIYRRRGFNPQAVLHQVLRVFPDRVRELRAYVFVAVLLFVIPTLVFGLLVYRTPEVIYLLIDPATVASFNQMYGPEVAALGRARDAQTDWVMLGFYISHNMTVAIQCFAGGVLMGVGSVFYLIWNGAFGGAVAGYLTQHGLAAAFYSFIVTHSAFELTAIVLSGAAGLRLGHALISPGPHTRVQALVLASREVAVVIYGALALLLLAAIIEAFWSSAVWIPRALKYSVAAFCWAGVIGWLTLARSDAG